MQVKFNLPATRTCKVVYVRNGVTYQSIITTPRSNDELQQIMLTRKVGVSQIQTVEPIEGLKPFVRTHPAAHRMAQYQTLADK